MTAQFITFEGIDGCGKSTQLQLCAEWLKEQGIRVLTTFEPGDTALGASIRKLLLSGEHVPYPEAELLLFLADRAQHMREIILPALQSGTWVLCDRFTDSTIAYQMAGRKLDMQQANPLLKFAELGRSPNLTLWFDVAVETALARMQQRNAKGGEVTRMDKEKVAFHQAVSNGFVAIHRNNPQRIRCIDAEAGIDAIQQQVRSIVQKELLEKELRP